ncbi:hypothetical protein HN371_08330 [Candidatus Poribacteria bacterium]|jgi:hypothetical protein|nr:hypothetical protein [Candidatus Poribacteria bacterium]MBT5535903.1 hypothetical protein [Candidatus Poribacteria bacterium]MBT5712449.1 hypothetical protein [Candidatus Poribacteria bacterium]MBT7100267.1 hypothetical protein [Candidatus Poribacteria bacterium]MBT7808974.1 hypothetical protein [Candidatus Poribacteria bacterium]
MAESEERTEKGLIEKNWVLGAMIGVLLLLGVALWWLATHPDQVAAWVSPDRSQVRVEKPS